MPGQCVAYVQSTLFYVAVLCIQPQAVIGRNSSDILLPVYYDMIRLRSIKQLTVHTTHGSERGRS